jgi:TetR/AcrR family transcriptional regulator, lmrAB and yxaGH operons repressor
MPAPIASQEEILDRLTSLFRDKGYDGASLSEISAATGLGKSSLYHHFPGGKEDMARQVLDHLAARLENTLFEPLRAPRAPARKLGALIDGLAAFYENGAKACLLERMCATADATRFRRAVGRMFAAWIDAIEKLCLEAGVPRSLARSRAEDFVIRTEGALVVCAGTADATLFARTLKELKKTLLEVPAARS